MKSQRRHELQTNYLADHLGSAVQTGKPYAAWMLVGAAGLLVLAVVYGLYSTRVAKANSEAWGDYYFNIGSGDSEIFQQVAEDHPGSSASPWALQAWSDNQLLNSMDQIYTSRKQAEAGIEKAIAGYESVMKSTYEPELKDRAAMGLAQAYETIGKLDEATRYYQQVVSGSMVAYSNLASQRLAWIKSGEGKVFYDWLATVRSATEAPPKLPGDLSRPPSGPGALEFPKKQNPLDLPDAMNNGKPAGVNIPIEGLAPTQIELPGSTEPKTPAADQTPAATPAGETPAKDTPAAEAPASGTPAPPDANSPGQPPAANEAAPGNEPSKPQAAAGAKPRTSLVDVPPKPANLPPH